MEIESITQLLSGYDNAFFASFIVSILIIASGRLHLRYSARGHGDLEVQKSHEDPTPRIGGLAILAGCAYGWYEIENFSGRYLGYILISSMPVLILGLLDDLHFYIRPLYRLIGAAISSIFAIFLLDTWLTGIDVLFLDQLFFLSPFAILFTIFATTGVAHAFNLIDGLNGLSLGISLSTSFFLTVVAWMAADALIVLLCLIFFLSTLGLFLLNFPWGKIFLGDGGAYFQGHCLSWIAILLLARNPDITAWAILLIFFWPVVETLFSIYRRVYKNKSASAADREHFHQLVFDKMRRLKIFQNSANFANSFSTLLILPLFMVPNLLALVVYNNIEYATITFFILLSLYIYAYHRVKASL